jgi:hypothetical protein
MSKWNSYGKRLNEIVERGTKAYREAEKALKDAEKEKKEYPQKYGIVDASYAAKSARAEANYLEAKEKMKAARNMLTRGQTEIANLRKEFAAAVDKESVLDASKVDANSLELLKSGIMTVNDYTKMFEDAKASGNHTMMRLVGKYASEAAESEKDYRKSASLRVLGVESKKTGASECLDAFDVCADCYNRGVTNPRMLDFYESKYKDSADNL